MHPLVSVAVGCDGKDFEVYVDDKRLKRVQSLKALQDEYPYFVYEQDISARQARKLESDGAACVCCDEPLSELYNFDAPQISVFVQLNETTLDADGFVCPDCARQLSAEKNVSSATR